MREIKFRAWEPLWSKMHHPETIYNLRGETSFWFGAQGGGRILLQYTGLKDKNGVDIYEHDIMRIKLPLGGFWGNVSKEKIGVVKYSEDFAGFIVEWEYSINQHHVRLDCDFAIEGEIFGNIYEHPHLLNTEK